MEYMYLYLFICGLFFGSFLNVLADRLSREETINGRSKCESCKKVLAWYDLIPVLSYVMLRAKCRYCRAPISWQYPAAEIITGVMFVLTYILSTIFYHSLSLTIINLALSSVILVVLLSDLRYQVIPDEMQVALIILSIGKFIHLNMHFGQNLMEQVLTMSFLIAIGWFLLAGVVTMLPLLTLFLITKGKGMGFGDVKLAFGIGLFLGLWNGLLALYISFMIGGLVGLILLGIKKGSLKTKIAFGPFLIFGLFVMQYFEYWIWLWLQQVYGF